MDFRTRDEHDEAPDMEMDGVQTVFLPVMNTSETAADSPVAAVGRMIEEVGADETIPADKKGTVISIKMAEMDYTYDKIYISILDSGSGKTGYRKFFSLLLEQPEGEAVLCHCKSGKDRTGVAAALLMSVLGMDMETILDDYELTNVFLAEKIANAKQMASDFTDDDDIISKTDDLAGVNRMFMEKTLKWLDENYGSPEGYVKTALELSDEDIRTLQEKYLEAAE